MPGPYGPLLVQVFEVWHIEMLDSVGFQAQYVFVR